MLIEVKKKTILCLIKSDYIAEIFKIKTLKHSSFGNLSDIYLPLKSHLFKVQFNLVKNSFL